ncbi:ABC transporter permease [Paenibacillus radicis (ex Xue et al. 2023)]|uniref:ABC transporter permease n=1 Tax=Paenibacillus radicis (ex Xue et al. 2023) TaxID=2972489 RepID=A0ABT1YSX1_9BACL|nr:ABC transporter permease [Paenibacillus radicis (ex Xue et al. 2023)]MCR8635795.1 ABC transporter permease [Paenibacillus radicis (ex Xue et al. 2023)]
MKTREHYKKYMYGIILPAIILTIWQLVGSLHLVPPQLLPTPIQIFEAFITLIGDGVLLDNLSVSIYRAVVGFVIGGGLGLISGLLVGFFRKTEYTLDPTLQMIRTVPHLAIMPLFILWFGFGEFSKVLLIAKGAFFPLYLNTFLGIRGIDSKLFEVSRVLEFSRFKQVTKLILPSAMPNILLGLRLSLGMAWLSLIVAELMGANSGVGYMISDARQFAQTDVVFVGIVIFALVGKLTDSLVRKLEDRLLRWRDSYDGADK